MRALVFVFCAVNLACSGGRGIGGGSLGSGSGQTPPPGVTVAISPSEVEGGQTATIVVTFSPAVPSGGLTANLSVDNPLVVILPNPTLMVAAGATTAMFTVTTTTVPAQTTVNISAAVTTGGKTSSGSVPLKVDATTTSQVQSVVLGPPTTLEGAQTVPGTVTLTTAPIMPAVVQLSSSAPSVATFANSSVPIPAGQTTGSFSVMTSPVTSQTSVTITGTLNSPASATLTLQPLQVTALTVSPGTVVGGQGGTGTVTLGGPAASGGTMVNLSSTSGSATVPTTVTVPAGSTIASFGITSSPVSSLTVATISAALNGSQKVGTLTINPPVVSSLTFNLSPLNASSGQSVTGTVSLNANAPSPNGLTVNLVSNNPAAFPVPASLNFPPNTSVQSFVTIAGEVSVPTAAMITASTGAIMVSVNLTVLPPPVVQLSFVPQNVIGGTTSTGTVTISETAPPGGVFVSLASSSPSTVIVPASGGVTVPAGSTMGTFTVTTKPVSASTPVTVTASSGSSLNAMFTLTVLPPTLDSLVLNPTMITGNTGAPGNVSGTVILTGPAPTGGLTVSLSSSNPNPAIVLPNPATVNIPAGASMGTFTVTTAPVAITTDSNIIAMLAGSNPLMADLTVIPPVAMTLSFNPTNVASGQTSTGTITLTGPAPAGGVPVTFTSSNSTVFPVPAGGAVSVPAGSSSQTFVTPATGAVAMPTAVTVTATAGGTTVTAPTVTVVSSVTVASVTLNQTMVTGGTSVTGTVTLGQAAPAGGVTVVMSSSDPSVTVPNVMIAAGATSAPFTATTVGVTAATPATVKGTAGGSSATSQTLTVNPPQIKSFTISPGSITGGTGTVTGTLTLTGPAPPGGALAVTLMSNNTNAATVPAFNIAAGTSSNTFTITTFPIAANANVTIMATVQLQTPISMNAALTVNAPVATMLTFSPSTVVSGQMTTGTVTLSGPAPTGGLPVTFASNNSSAFPVPPNPPAAGSVTVPAGASGATFVVMPGAVAGSTTVTVMATAGGATVTAPAVTVVPSMTVVSVTFSPTTVTGGSAASGSTTGTVTVGQAAPAGGITVNLTSTDPTVTIPGVIIIPATKTTQTFTAKTTVGVTVATAEMVTATVGASNQTGTFTVNPPTISSFTFNPNSPTGGNASVATVVLNGPAAPGGMTFNLTSSMASVAAPTMGTVTIMGGTTSGTFNVTTFPVALSTPVTITAAPQPSGTSVGGGLTVIPPVVSSVTFNPMNVASGGNTTGTLTLNGGVPAAGINVGLSSSDQAIAPVSPSTTVTPTVATFMLSMPAGAVSSSTPVTVTATTGTTSVMGMLNVTPALTVNSSSLAFAGTQITLQSAATPVTLTNNSTSSAAITNITVGGTDPSDFLVTATGGTPCPITGGMLAASSSCTFSVTFTPTKGGSRTGTVMVTSPVNSVTVTVMGTGFHWVSLTWSECVPSMTCPAVNDFNVYRITVATGTATCPTSGYSMPPLNPALIPYSISPTYSDLTVSAGTTYCYVVTALNGGGESAFSAPVSPPVVIPSP